VDIVSAPVSSVKNDSVQGAICGITALGSDSFLKLSFSMPRVVKRLTQQAVGPSPSGRDVPLPRFVSPQLSLSVETPPSGSQWVHEIKLDGYRMAARIDNWYTQLLTRTGLDWTGKYPSIAEALGNLNAKSSASKAWSQRRLTRLMPQETVACGAKRKPSIGKNSSSSAGPIRKGRGLISGRCCSGTTPTRASSPMPVESAQECPIGFLQTSGAALNLALSKPCLNVMPPRKTRFGSPLVLSRVHWVEPKLVAEITYLTWTADNLLRHTVYVGLREDKPADQVRREPSKPR